MRKQITQLVDDLDGTVIDDGGETIRFALDGREFEIDLSDENSRQLRAAFEPFIRAGRSVAPRLNIRSGRGNSGGSSSRGRSSSSEDLAAIREWANKNGYEVGDRGRIAASVREAYEAANS